MMLPGAALIGIVFALLFLTVFFEGQPGQPGPFGLRTHHWPSAIAGSSAIGLILVAFFCLLAVVDRVTAQPCVLLTGTIDEGGVLDVNFSDTQVATREVAAVELIRPTVGARWPALAWLPLIRSVRYTQGLALVVRKQDCLLRLNAGAAACAPMGLDRRLACQLADILEVPLRDGHASEVDSDGRFFETPRECID